MPTFPGGYGAQITDPTAVDEDDGLLVAIDGLVKEVAVPAVRALIYTSASTGASYTATRTSNTEDFLLSVTANTTITLAGGGVAGLISLWNIVFKQDATGGRTITVNSVVWVGGTPSFTTTALASNHCSFVQHGTGTIWGYFGGAAAS